MRLAPAGASLALVLLAGCGGEAAAPTPGSCEVVGLDAILADLAPRPGDRAVVLNLWATW